VINIALLHTWRFVSFARNDTVLPRNAKTSL